MKWGDSLRIHRRVVERGTGTFEGHRALVHVQVSLQVICRPRQIYLAAIDAFRGPVPSPDMAMGTGSDDAIFLETKPAHWIVIHDFGLVYTALAFSTST